MVHTKNVVIFLVAVLIATLLTIRIFPHPLPTARAAGSFVVNTGSDIYAFDNNLSLREAVAVANGDLAGPLTDGEKNQLGGCSWLNSSGLWYITGNCGATVADTITFAPTVTTVTLVSSGLSLQDDGDAIIGNGFSPAIDAANVSSSSTFGIYGNYISIKYLAIYNSDQNQADIQVYDGNGSEIAYNYLGAPYHGMCTDLSRYGGYGVKITTTDGSATLGDGSAYIYGNMIGCHAQDGILVMGTDFASIGVDRTGYAMPNRIGIEADETPYPNAGAGIRLTPNATDIVNLTWIIGNQISNNSLDGILIESSAYTVVRQNMIGISYGGISAAPNLRDGIRIVGPSSTGNFIGTNFPSDANVISGNGGCGVNLLAHANQNSIKGNRIGTNFAGNIFIPNSYAGIAVQTDSFENQIGSNEIGVANQLIAGNAREGIYFFAAVDNLVGHSNIIRNNGLAGVVLADAASLRNAILPGEIFGNGGLPIDLGNDGPTVNDPNDADSGANTLLNYPVVTQSTSGLLVGTVCSGCKVYLYKAIGDPAKPGGGGQLLGFVSSFFTDWSADLSTFPGGAGLTAEDVTMVAWDQSSPTSGNTSEMRPLPHIYLPIVQKH